MSRKKTSRTAKNPRVPAETQTISSRLDAFLVSRRFPVALAAIIVCAGLLVYVNSMSGEFVFDDEPNIEENIHIRQLWPSVYLSHPGPRSLGMYTFAINYAVHGLDVWGYHTVNLAIHLSAGLLLFGIVRRTLKRDGLAQRYGEAADGIAFAVALLWVVHPLQTQAVTYIVQRLESLMGLCYLGTLYCFIRAVDSRRPWPWYVASILCVGLGAGVKEVIVTAPVVMVWYDRAFVSKSWGQLMQRRWGYYLAYILAALPFVPRLVRWAFFASPGSMVGVGSEAPGVWEYLRSQPGVLLHYLRLCVWPTGQCLDYDWPVANGLWQIVPPGLVILGLLGVTIWCVFRHKEWSFVGGCFFLILAPTSSVVPLADLAFEHRMYLPLATILVTFAVAAFEVLNWQGRSLSRAQRETLASASVVVLAITLGWMTTLRNEVYSSTISVWSDVVTKAPANTRARKNLATAYYNRACALCDSGDLTAAIRANRHALEYDPLLAEAINNMGLLFMRVGRVDEATAYFHNALTLDPNLAEAHLNLAKTCMESRPDEAVGYLKRAVQVAPDYAEGHNNLGYMLLLQGELQGSVEHLQRAVTLSPDNALAHYNLADALAQARRLSEATKHFHIARELNPNWWKPPDALQTLLQEQASH